MVLYLNQYIAYVEIIIRQRQKLDFQIEVPVDLKARVMYFKTSATAS